MIADLDDILDELDINEFKGFLAEMKKEEPKLKEVTGGEDFIQFFMALIDCLEEETKGVNSLRGLDIKKKVRIYSLVHLCHEIMSAGDEDDFDDFDEDDFDDFDDDEDFDDEE